MFYPILLFYQASIRGLLLASLDDPYKKICTAISVAVSTIAQHDWPDDWPDLVPFLLSLISDQTKLNAGVSLLLSRPFNVSDIS